jgi:MFS transporter, DHA1 family, inner membrane transport protein
VSEDSEVAFSPGRERLILFVLAAVQFTSIVDFMIVMPLGPQLERELGLTPATFGQIVSSYTYAAGVAGLFASVFVDRFARRTAFLSVFAGFLLGTLACGLAQGYEWLLAARVLTGAFGGILGGLALAIIGDVFPENRRGWASGMLMSAFAVASVVGVPLGIALGSRFGWHVPFVTLAALGVPVFFVAASSLPRLDRHLTAERQHPFVHLWGVFTEPNHLRAFALTVALMVGGFTAIPFLSPYLVSNVGVTEEGLAIVYIAGGVVTLVGSPIAGRLADRFGKLLVFRCISPLFALAVLAATNLPPVSLAAASLVMAALMLTSACRMVPAMAMITSSVHPSRRGGFLGANSAVQHVAAGLGASIGGWILSKHDGKLEHYPIVGIISVVGTLVSLWLAGRLRIVTDEHTTSATESLAAAAQGTVDADEAAVFVESEERPAASVS